MIPFSIALTVLLAAIIVLFYMVNESSGMLSELMQKNETYTLDATALELDMNILATTVENLLKKPTKSDGSTNTGPLKTYARQLSEGTHAPEIVERFRQHDVPDEARQYIISAAEASKKMREIQGHIIALMASVYPLPPLEELSVLPNVPLTDAELAMTEEERLNEAQSIFIYLFQKNMGTV